MNTINFSITKAIIVIALFMIFPHVIFAAGSDYTFGHGALDIFGGQALSFTPMWVKAWLVLLIGTFISSAYFAWKQPLARWAIGGFIISMSAGHTIFAALNLPFLGGSIAIMHIVFWSPALILLLIKRPFLNTKQPTSFRIWSGLMAAVIIFSFIFDFRDAVIYINHIMVI